MIEGEKKQLEVIHYSSGILTRLWALWFLFFELAHILHVNL